MTFGTKGVRIDIIRPVAEAPTHPVFFFFCVLVGLPVASFCELEKSGKIENCRAPLTTSSSGAVRSVKYSGESISDG